MGDSSVRLHLKLSSATTGNYAFERDPLVGSCHFYCVQHMGMKKTRLTRKRSINNSLVALTTTPSSALTTNRLELGGITRERISVGTHSPLGSPTDEMPPSSPLLEDPFKPSLSPGSAHPSIKRFLSDWSLSGARIWSIVSCHLFACFPSGRVDTMGQNSLIVGHQNDAFPRAWE